MFVGYNGRLSVEERVSIVKGYFKYGECYSETVRKLLGCNRAPKDVIVHKIIAMFENSSSVCDAKKGTLT